MENRSPQVQSTSAEVQPPNIRNIALVTLALTLLSVFVAVIPHLFVYEHYKNFRFFSNFDDQVYSAISKTAYFDGRLREPYTRPEQGAPSLYAPLLFVPYARLTRMLDLLPVDVLGIMRICGGLMLGMALTWCLYAFLEGTRRRLFWVAICGAIYLCDSGTVGGRCVIANLVEIRSIFVRGWPPLGDFLTQFRVAAALLCLPFLLILVASVRNVSRLSKRDIAIGTLALVALIYSYFYYWLAAALLLGALLAMEIAKALLERKTPLNASVLGLAFILVVGMAIGAPQIYGNAHTFAQPQYKPILDRIARGQSLLPNDPIRFLHVWNYWALAKLAFGAVVIVALRLWKIGVIWMLACIGYILTNLAIFVKIDFENHHWVAVTNPLTELMVLVLLAFCCERLLAWSKVRLVAPVLALLIVISGATVRGMNTLRADFGSERTAALQRVLPLAGMLPGLGPDCTIVGASDDAEAVFQLSRCSMLFSTPYTALITPISDREVNERQALTYWLEGWSAEAYGAIAGYPMSWNNFGHPEWQPPFLVKARGAIFAQLNDPAFRQPLIARYKPTHLVINESSGRKPAASYQWKQIATANGVKIFELINP